MLDGLRRRHASRPSPRPLSLNFSTFSPPPPSPDLDSSNEHPIRRWVSVPGLSISQRAASWKMHEIFTSIYKKKKEITPCLSQKISLTSRNTCWSNGNDVLVGCLIDSFPHVWAPHSFVHSSFHVFCLHVCGCERGGSVVYCCVVSREFQDCVGLKSSFLLFHQVLLKICKQCFLSLSLFLKTFRIF